MLKINRRDRLITTHFHIWEKIFYLSSIINDIDAPYYDSQAVKWLTLQGWFVCELENQTVL